MWFRSELGRQVPVVAAPMAGPGDGTLAQAVSAAGALGTIGVSGSHSGDWLREQAAVAGAHGQPYGVGLMAWTLPQRPDLLDTVIDLAPALVSVSFPAAPEQLTEPLARLGDAGIRTATQVGNLDELDAALVAGVDVLVARGGEGGGHGRNELGTLPLLQLVLERTNLPVLAAGGIINHRGLAAVLAAGADGAWVGTAFLACREAGSSPAARNALIGADRTGYGRVFDVAQDLDWPAQYGGRAVANPFFDEWAGREDEIDDEARDRLAAAREAEDYRTQQLYAGEGVVDLAHEAGAADVVAEFARALNHEG